MVVVESGDRENTDWWLLALSMLRWSTAVALLFFWRELFNDPFIWKDWVLLIIIPVTTGGPYIGMFVLLNQMIRDG